MIRKTLFALNVFFAAFNTTMLITYPSRVGITAVVILVNIMAAALLALVLKE